MNINTSNLNSTNNQYNLSDTSLNENDKLSFIKNKYTKLKSTINHIEDNYKNIIKKLFHEIQTINQGNKEFHPDLNLDNSIIKEINEIINDNANNTLDSSAPNKLLASISSNETTTLNNMNNQEKALNNGDSMMIELDSFKKDGLSNFKFEIPIKYQIGKNLKVLKEVLRKDGTILKYYENSFLEVVYKNNTINRIFPDGFTITFYANKDIKQNYNDGRIIYFFAKNKSLEFNFAKLGFIAYKFKNNQLEKHFFDGRKYIRFSDGSYKIIRPNGEELNEFNDGKIQRKDKFGKITYNYKL